MNKDERRRQLLAELALLDAEVATGPSSEQRKSKSRSVRDLILDSLHEIGFMTYAQQLTVFIRARYGREIAPTRFGTLSADEVRAFKGESSRTLWLTHGLTYDRAEPVKRLWGRSDWKLECRIVTPLFGRAQYLRATARFAEIAMSADETSANPDLMRFFAADLAKDLGIAVRRGEFDLQSWKEIAETQLAKIAVQERDGIEAVVSKLEVSLGRAEMLFGRSDRSAVVAVGVSERQA